MPNQTTQKTTLIVFSVIALLTLFTLYPVQGAAEPSDPALEEQALELQSLYGEMTSLAFDFEQVTRTGGRERSGVGNAVFYKTGTRNASGTDIGTDPESVMRWNYTDPDKQVIINDGETLTIYTEEDRQLIKTPAKEIESDITYAFFAGTRNLLDDFTVQVADGRYIFSAASELHSLLLVPRVPHNQIREVRIWFDDKGIIHHMVIEDHFDSVTELHFTNIELNSLVPGDREEIDRITSLTVPQGTEIISR